MRMYVDKTDARRRATAIRAVLIALLLVLVVVLGVSASFGVRDDMRQGATESIREAVMRSALQCYAVEGAYPTDIGYLQENYGLQVNTDDYEISYQVYASNIAPDVEVFAKGGQS